MLWMEPVDPFFSCLCGPTLFLSFTMYTFQLLESITGSNKLWNCIWSTKRQLACSPYEKKTSAGGFLPASRLEASNFHSRRHNFSHTSSSLFSSGGARFSLCVLLSVGVEMAEGEEEDDTGHSWNMPKCTLWAVSQLFFFNWDIIGTMLPIFLQNLCAGSVLNFAAQSNCNGL